MTGTSQQAAYGHLGISYNTWRKRLESDGFTFQDLVKLGNLTSLGISAIVTSEVLETTAATAKSAA